MKTTEYFRKTFCWKSDSKTQEDFTVIKNNVRLSVLTDRLLRVEVDKKKRFTDAPTQAVINRNFAHPEFRDELANYADQHFR